MIRTYRTAQGSCIFREGTEALQVASQAAWIDLHSPSEVEEEAIERIVGADIPTREEMAEIEASSRIYSDRDAAVMTLPLLIKSDAAYPESTDVTFVLTARHLATVRYAEPTSFQNFAAALKRNPEICASPHSAFAGLLDAMVERIADVLEGVGEDLDRASREIFGAEERAGRPDYKQQIQRAGRNGAIVSKARESLVGLARVTAFARELDQLREDKFVMARLKTVARDAEVLAEHAGYLSGKITFLLDANLGMINSEQNAIIKIFSVVAVVFLPPTLIASIYGMNFEHIPELDLVFGYPLALAAMVVSMIVPLVYFKRKRWI